MCRSTDVSNAGHATCSGLAGHLFACHGRYSVLGSTGLHGDLVILLPVKMINRRHDDNGFTLLELMVVVVILSILALVIVPRIIDRPDQARIARVQSDIAVLENALKLYKLDNNRFPTTEQGLRALIEKPSRDPVPLNWATNGYVDRLPNDPWGNPYQFLSPGVKGEIDLFSYGADGTTGGDGLDADIGNWIAK